MPEYRLDAGATHIFPAGTLGDTMDLQNRHNVGGNAVYQIAARPLVTVPIQPNQPDVMINSINGQQLQVWNNLPNSLYCVW
jgi:hypothetical protein